jgi:IK cytokine
MALEFIKNVSEKYGSTGARKEGVPSVKSDNPKGGKKGEDSVAAAIKVSNMMGLKFDPLDSYSECYPGTHAEEDVNIDSDDEADYSQMDTGKKGPLNKWDFATNEEYGSYMSSKEAMPKAAFQFGQKLGDGRKTRREGGGPGGDQKDKVKLDKEWTQISKLIEKRKTGDNEAGYKKPKY